MPVEKIFMIFGQKMQDITFNHIPIVYHYVYNRVQWFWLFFTFWGITTHPWHPKGPRIWKLAKKNFKLHPWPAEIFGKNRKMRFFGLVSKFDFRSHLGSLPFFQHVLFMEALIHILNFRCLSQKLHCPKTLRSKILLLNSTLYKT